MANYGVCEDIEPSGSFDMADAGGGGHGEWRVAGCQGFISRSVICYGVSALLKRIHETSCYQEHSSGLTDDMKLQFKDLHQSDTIAQISKALENHTGALAGTIDVCETSQHKRHASP